MEANAFGTRLRQIRRDRLMTQEQLETASGVSQGQISAIESGRQPMEGVSTGVLFALCRALQCNPVWMVTGQGSNDPEAIDPRLTALLEAAQGLNEAGLSALMVTAKALSGK